LALPPLIVEQRAADGVPVRGADASRVAHDALAHEAEAFVAAQGRDVEVEHAQFDALQAQVVEGDREGGGDHGAAAALAATGGVDEHP